MSARSFGRLCSWARASGSSCWALTDSGICGLVWWASLADASSRPAQARRHPGVPGRGRCSRSARHSGSGRCSRCARHSGCGRCSRCGRRCGRGRCSLGALRSGGGPATRPGRGRRRAWVLLPGHGAAVRPRCPVRGPACPTGRRRLGADRASRARSGRRYRPGAGGTSASLMNFRPGSRRRKNAPSPARSSGGPGCPARIRRRGGRLCSGRVRCRRRRPGAVRFRAGRCDGSRLRPRAAPAGYPTGPSPGTRRPRCSGLAALEPPLAPPDLGPPALRAWSPVRAAGPRRSPGERSYPRAVPSAALRGFLLT